MYASCSRPSAPTPSGSGAPLHPTERSFARNRCDDAVNCVAGRSTRSPRLATAPPFATPPCNRRSPTTAAVWPEMLETRDVQPGEPVGIAEGVDGGDAVGDDREGHHRHDAPIGGDDDPGRPVDDGRCEGAA